MLNVDNIRVQFATKLIQEDYAEDGNLEIINASFLADQNVIFGKRNELYQIAELAWYLERSKSVHRLGEIYGKVPKVWQQVSSSDGTVNSNYGHSIFSHDNYYQFESAKNQLIVNRNTRRAVMIYNHPNMQQQYKDKGMNDFICTNNTQVLIRNNKLHYIVNMRSNDVVYGYINDKFWHDYVYDLMYIELLKTYPNLERGDMYWNVGSLHIYPRHFSLIKNTK
jgi:thymidylate synthase